jgi:hypothetical protein
LAAAGAPCRVKGVEDARQNPTVGIGFLVPEFHWLSLFEEKQGVEISVAESVRRE